MKIECKNNPYQLYENGLEIRDYSYNQLRNMFPLHTKISFNTGENLNINFGVVRSYIITYPCGFEVSSDILDSSVKEIVYIENVVTEKLKRKLNIEKILKQIDNN